MSYRRFALAALFLYMLATVVQAAPASRWNIIDLGDGFNPSYGAVYATSVNNRGNVSGWAYAGTNVPQHHAFDWSNGRLDDLGVPPGSYDSAVYGLNNRGTFVGHSAGSVAFYKDGAWTKLGLYGNANDVNDADTIVGSYNAAGTRAFMLKDGVFTDLGTLGPSFAVAYAVNRKDMVVGYSYNFQFQPRGFVYERGVMTDLGTLGGRDSYAYDINDRGVVVGAASDTTGRVVAMIWDGVMRPLLPNVGSYSSARSINDHGDVVGTVDGRGFLRERDGTLTMLEQLPAVASNGWSYLQPVAINDRGWIVGTGWRNGRGRSFLITPK